ncbi:EsaB/YukD family protein [Lysinibacillus odysseyi]|uniref:Ubiquitin n=1 Tax=Lysinibacillus odysseyi 34hs-1 = NBRC 100172 TaxID=1220589 RepID=A0A0A3JA79_9BACI|nr:EsaB/YukD family protein [Lysinibacillus odysseyi]KGR83937.1 ubiquitin [Lysinibacillus odysseyi 34hs-1 = NBRC 100172]
MYIEVTVDLKNYTGESFDIRLSDYYSVKQLVDVVWQVKAITDIPREGYWVRVQNKKIMLSGSEQLAASGVTTGDRLEIL